MKVTYVPMGSYAPVLRGVSIESVTTARNKRAVAMWGRARRAPKSARITHGAVVRTRSAQASRDAMAKTITVTVRPMKVTSAVEIKGV